VHTSIKGRLIARFINKGESLLSGISPVELLQGQTKEPQELQIYVRAVFREMRKILTLDCL